MMLHLDSIIFVEIHLEINDMNLLTIFLDYAAILAAAQSLNTVIVVLLGSF